jgi:hypothetical protein
VTRDKLERFRHSDKDRRGKYRASPRCDGCNKAVGTNYFSDEEVCGGSDGPGFYRCERVRCSTKLEKLNPEQREAIYIANREAR